MSDLSAIEAGLARANARLGDLFEAMGSRPRTDVAGLPPGAAAYTLATASLDGAPPTLVVTADLDSARRMAESLRFFLGESSDDEVSLPSVLVYPASDTTPYLDVAPDRRAAMDRLATLFHLALELPVRFVVAPAAGLLRRVPPRASVKARSTLIERETEVDRDALLRLLADAGYVRVPVAEDPGTFAVRGGLLDVFPPHGAFPARIELDDWLVMSIKLFDPEDQRTVRDVDRVFVHPVREALLAETDKARAKERVRDLCDHVDWPTSKTRALLDDLDSGRVFYGLDGLLPAFYDGLETVFDYLPRDARVAWLDPTAVIAAIEDERRRAKADLGAKVEAREPAFPLETHYLDTLAIGDAVEERRLTLVHKLAVGGTVGEDERSLARLESVAEAELLRLGGEDQSALVAELKARRHASDREAALEPVARRAASWLDAGMRVVFTARTTTQAERLIALLRGYEVPVEPKPDRFDPKAAARASALRARVVVGTLADGFSLATAGIAFVTEEEIFGSRTHRRSAEKRKRKKTEPFLEDLRELEVGDFVVHADHGIGKYLGLERKTIAQSASERMRGDEARAVEVLVIEYAGNDRLFVPVTRLGQIQKFASQEGHKPKLDRLGGQTFAKSKGKVARAVKQLAEELLKLYAERAAAERPALSPPDRSYAEFEATFPFEETPDQARAIEDVLGDLEGSHPMDRLVCGDVGFGKTEVAIRAAFRVAMSGRQVAILCPTTVLAQQHFLSFRDRLEDYPIRVGLLSRFVDRNDQTGVLAALKEGRIDVVVGTHRLLSKDVHFKDLGLLVVDEEQRFGVTHKERIKKLRATVDVLTLSATPIPRTLQLAIGGMRDLSLITTPPVDRRAVRTFACRWDEHTIEEAVKRELSRGGQIFYVYNRIEGLYERAHRLGQLVPTARIVVAHGQMKEDALERAMTDFVEGRYDLLCATAIVESGLDIPRANTMIVDRADAFGLAQLYQLRGRVGRSRERAYCYLVTPPPSQMTDDARARIEALERFTELGSGFHVASLDMELRGAGDLLGAEQSGNVSLVGFDLFVHMLEEAVAELRGEPIVHDVDPEITLDLEHYLPDDYIEDVGLRLSFYKRFANAGDEASIDDLATEMEDRFGPPPPPAFAFVRAMSLRPELRAYRVLGLEASDRRVALHLKDDTPLDPQKALAIVGKPGSPWRLTPDMKLTRRFDDEREGDTIDRVRETLRDLRPLLRS